MPAKDTTATSGQKSIKWTSLRHNGMLFPPEYEPHGVEFKYDGSPVKLGPAAEEVATFYAGILGTEYEANDTFKKNFFADFRKIIDATKGEVCPQDSPIKELDKCNFMAIAEWLKAIPTDEKTAVNQGKAQTDEQYQWAWINGRKEKIGNFRVEPPGLFCGHGKNAGKVKMRVRPEDIIINIGAKDPVPEPPAGHKWKDVVHNDAVTWLATWTSKFDGQTKLMYKYMRLSEASSWQGISDLMKFEVARKLKKEIKLIRDSYTKMLKHKSMQNRQMATALYFIDKFALRAGTEKGKDEAGTVGCCSLRWEHVTLESDNVVVLDFIGKASIPYHNEVTVDPQVYQNLCSFKENKKEGENLFHCINTDLLNKHLQRLMVGLTAKVFRTYHASFMFQQELAKTPEDGTMEKKVLAYEQANHEVAVLCNHQHATVDKDKDKKMETALESSKKYYIDPRITVAWGKKYNVSIEHMFAKALRDKFKWAMDVDANWEF